MCKSGRHRGNYLHTYTHKRMYMHTPRIHTYIHTHTQADLQPLKIQNSKSARVLIKGIFRLRHQKLTKYAAKRRSPLQLTTKRRSPLQLTTKRRSPLQWTRKAWQEKSSYKPYLKERETTSSRTQTWTRCVDWLAVTITLIIRYICNGNDGCVGGFQEFLWSVHYWYNNSRYISFIWQPLCHWFDDALSW